MSTIKTNAITTVAGKPILNSTGSVLQVVQTRVTSVVTVSSNNSFSTVTGLSASRTPSSSSSKILVRAALNTYHLNSGMNSIARINRNSGAAYSGTSNDFYHPTGGGVCGNIYIEWLDSPATTSSVTYQVEMTDQAGANTLSINKDYFGVNQGQSTVTLFEVSA